MMENLRVVAKKARRHVLEMAYGAKDSHIGCALSSVDVLVALYFRVMNVNPAEPDALGRDRFVLSKGHAASALYAVLCGRGFFSERELTAFAKDGSKIASHVGRGVLPGVETNGGSGGHGLSLGNGMALVARKDSAGSRIFVLMGDGELQEGSVWEAAMFASSRNLSNITLIVDRNMFQTWRRVDDVVAVEPIAGKFLAFGWNVDEVDGHNIEKLTAVLNKAGSRPHAVVARTVKGKGVSFMEGSGDWHNGVLTEEQYQKALEEVDRA
ncbi:MAG: transketolase [Candidatus Jorgensenbacteria bacterium]